MIQYVYATLSTDLPRRRQFHRVAAEWADQAGDLVEAAYHFTHAGLVEQVAEALAGREDVLVQRGQALSAAAVLDDALAQARRRGAGGDTLIRQLLTARGYLLTGTLRTAEAEANYRAALELASHPAVRADLVVMWSMHLGRLASAQMVAGDAAAAQTTLRKALALLAVGRNPQQRVDLYTLLALARAPGVPTLECARALAMIGFLAREMDDLAIAQHLLEESLRLYQQLGELGGQAEVLNRLSMVALSQGDSATTDSVASQSVAMFRSTDQPLEATGPLLLAGDAAYLMHDYERAQAAYTESLSLAQEDGRLPWVTRRMIRLGQVAQARGAPAQAATQIVEVLHLSRQANDKWCITMALAALASAAVVLGSPIFAARLLAATDALLTRSGVRLWPVDHTEYQRTMISVRDQLDEASFMSEWAAGHALPLEQMVEDAIALVAPT